MLIKITKCILNILWFLSIKILNLNKLAGGYTVRRNAQGVFFLKI